MVKLIEIAEYAGPESECCACKKLAVAELTFEYLLTSDFAKMKFCYFHYIMAVEKPEKAIRAFLKKQNKDISGG